MTNKINENKSHYDYLKWKRKNVSLRGTHNPDPDDTNGNGGAAMLGVGLYTAALSNRELARKYGKVYFVLNGKPKNPISFRTLNDWEIYYGNVLIMSVLKPLGYTYPNSTKFNEITNIKTELEKLGYDGVEIKGREYVNFKPENVIYFENETQLMNYYYSLNISENIKYHIDNNIKITDNIFRPYSNEFYNILNESRQLFDDGFRFYNSDDELFETTDIGKFEFFNDELVPLDLPMPIIDEEILFNKETLKLNENIILDDLSVKVISHNEDYSQLRAIKNDIELIFEYSKDNFKYNLTHIVLEALYKGKKVKINKPMRSSGPKKYKVYVKNPKNGKIKIVHFGDVNGGLKAKVSDPEARKRFAARHKCHLKNDKTKPGYWACRVNRFAYLWNNVSYPGFW